MLFPPVTEYDSECSARSRKIKEPGGSQSAWACLDGPGGIGTQAPATAMNRRPSRLSILPSWESRSADRIPGSSKLNASTISGPSLPALWPRFAADLPHHPGVRCRSRAAARSPSNQSVATPLQNAVLYAGSALDYSYPSFTNSSE